MIHSASKTRVNALMGTRPEVMKRLVADFEQVRPGVPRTREIMTLAQEWGG